jgi:iron complex outermembrane recepter protein
MKNNKEMKKITGLVLMLNLTLICQAQTKNAGYIKDETGNPIPNATIHLLNTDVSVLSNDSGLFILPVLPDGRYSIETSAIGFAKTDQSVNLPAEGNMNISMKKSAIQLDEVIVSAEKKEANNLVVPISISALSSRDVDAYRLWASKDLKGVVSNLYAADPGDGRYVMSIRGITSTSYDPAVVTYIDGVPQFTLDTYIPQLFDVDHIDVLKGPQGTLYGRNAMGGVINIVTKMPNEQTRFALELTEGNHGLQRYTAQFSTPLIAHKLYLGVAALYEGSGGYYTNDFNHSKFDKQHRFADNISLKYLLNSAWSFTLNMKNLWNRNNGAFTLNPSIQDAFVNPYHLDQNAIGEMTDNTLNGSLVIRHTGSKVDFSSQTAYQSNYRFYQTPVDGDFSPYDAVSIINNYGRSWNNVNAITEELRLSSAASSKSPLSWAVGSYLFVQNAPNKQATHFGKDAYIVGSTDSLYSIVNTTTIKNEGFAFYGQAEYAITRKFSVAGGIRYDYQESKSEVSGIYLPDGSSTGFPTQADTSGKTNFNAVSPMLSVSFKPDSKTNFYLSYRRGYRTGGLTQLSTDPSQPPLYPYKPEYSNNFELGVKNNFFNNRFNANLAVFYNTVVDAQVPTLILPDAITVVKNAGGLLSKGFDAELKGILLPGLEVTYNFGYTNSKYTSGQLSSYGNTLDLDGKRQVFTPDVTSMLAAQYSRGFGRSVNAFIRGEWFYFGQQYFDLANQQTQTSYHLLNASAGVSFKQTGISFWMRNLTGTKYIAYAYDFGAAKLGDPSIWGISLKYRF